MKCDHPIKILLVAGYKKCAVCGQAIKSEEEEAVNETDIERRREKEDNN